MAEADRPYPADLHHGAAPRVRAVQDALGGVTGRPISLMLRRRQLVAPAQLSPATYNIIIEVQLEYPGGVEHRAVVLAVDAELSKLCHLPSPGESATLAAETLLNLGDFISTFLDTLVHERNWLPLAPRASLARLEPITADPATSGFSLPPQLAGEPQVVVLSVVLAGDPDARCDLELILSQTAESTLRGLSDEAGSVPAGPATPLTDAERFDAPNVVSMRPSRQESGGKVAGDGVQPVQFVPLSPDRGSGTRNGLSLLKEVPLQLSVELGSTSLTVREVLGLRPGAVVELDRPAGDPVDIMVNDQLIARGEVVVLSESLGIKITEVLR